MHRLPGSTSMPARNAVTAPRRCSFVRPSLASKRVLSEGDVVNPRSSKRSRFVTSLGPQKRPIGAVSKLDAATLSAHTLESGGPCSSITSWRVARKRQRERRLARRAKLALATSSSAGNDGSAHANVSEQQNAIKTDVLPELRLLSATRTAPIGWSQFAGASAFRTDLVEEVYDERDAKRAPERQRFWPIIDHQLDYTGARLLSLSNKTAYRADYLHDPHAHSDANFSSLGLVSPKSRFPLHPVDGLASVQPSRPVYSRVASSSEEERSPLTPGAPARGSNRPSAVPAVSRQARDVVENESNREARISLSPAATLASVIDFTRAQAREKRQRSEERNAYGQLVHSPPSSMARTELAAYAPPRIAPRPQTSSKNQSRDYFGHWEAYLCNYGKESTF